MKFGTFPFFNSQADQQKKNTHSTFLERKNAITAIRFQPMILLTMNYCRTLTSSYFKKHFHCFDIFFEWVGHFSDFECYEVMWNKFDVWEKDYVHRTNRCRNNIPIKWKKNTHFSNPSPMFYAIASIWIETITYLSIKL